MPGAVSVIIPHWNRRELLTVLLPLLGGQTLRPAEVIVVDNGSSDGSAEEAERLGARVVLFERNRGFAAAVNAGIRRAAGPWLAILNNDVEPRRDWLEKLVAGCEAAGVSYGCGKLLDARDPGRLDGTFDLISRGAVAERAGHGRPDGEAWNEPRGIALAPLTAALFHRSVFEKVGELDERFESYLEDVDFGIRCALAGLKGRYVPEAVASHWGSGTLGAWHPDTVRRIARNQLLLIAKHYPANWVWHFGCEVVVAQLLWGAAAWRHGAGLAWARGKWEGARALTGRERAPDLQVAEFLSAQQRELLELQKRHGFERLWRLYFRWTWAH
ncbi:MAG: glycosyltransferase family 2 protein [Acidobacteria bacterium]|nr:glycosyltransferase family 2 protein [Acidobacteriota bacterium]